MGAAVVSGLVRQARSHSFGGSSLRRASDLAGAARRGEDRLLPVLPALRDLLPAGGLRRGSTVAVAPGADPGEPGAGPSDALGEPGAGLGAVPGGPGSGSLLLALLAGPSAAGAWVAVVGLPSLGVLAAAQAGVVLSRLALVPEPGPEWPAVTAALLDGVDLVAVVPPGPARPLVASRLAARARLRGAALLPYGRWAGADLTLAPEAGEWVGLGAGHGRLRWRELTVTARGRGAAARVRRARLRLPDPAGRVAAAPCR